MAVNITGRKPLSCNKRSHALNTTKKQSKLNLQIVRLADGTRVRLSAREIRALRKNTEAA